MRTRIKGRCTATVAEFIAPGWGDKVKSGIGLLSRPASHVARRAGTTTLCRSWLYSQSEIFEFGYWCTVQRRSCGFLYGSYNIPTVFLWFHPLLWIRIRFSRILMFLGLGSGSVIICTDSVTDPSIINQNSKKNLDFYCFVTSLWLFIFEEWCKCTFKRKTS